MTRDDAPNLLGIFSDAEAMRYYRSAKDEAETREWINLNLMSYRLWRFGLWMAELKATGEFVGQCALVMQRVEDQPEVEIGYLFSPQVLGPRPRYRSRVRLPRLRLSSIRISPLNLTYCPP